MVMRDLVAAMALDGRMVLPRCTPADGGRIVYDVHATNEDGSVARFESMEDEPLKIGDYVNE